MPRLFVLPMVALLALAPIMVQARDQNSVITDRELTDSATMDISTVDRFLKNKGALGYKFFQDTDGITRTPAEIIWRVATTHAINPQFLLALIQKEQSLVDDPRPSQDQIDWAAGYGICDSCLKSDPLLQRFRGFGKQIEGAARQFREDYLPRIALAGETSARMSPGRTASIDGIAVTPQNAATAALYTYTPHLHGNLLLATIWDKWFTKKYPDGALLRSLGDQSVWKIENGKKRPFASFGVFLTRYSPDRLVEVDPGILDQYEVGPRIAFANYSLLQTKDGTTYLVLNETYRRIASPKVFRLLGFNPEEVEDIEAADLADMIEGPAITTKNGYPQGALLQNKKTGGIYFVQDEVRHPIWSREILNENFKGRRIIKVAANELGEYELGDPVLFEDGDLIGVRDTNEVYLVSGGRRRPIRRDALAGFGWRESSVIWTSRRAVEIHPQGDVIEPIEIQN